MSVGIALQLTSSRVALGESTEPQLLYAFLEMTPQGQANKLPRLPLNLCLVIDRSSSMRGERLLQVKGAAQRILDILDDNDYFALVTFNDRADVVISSQRARNRTEMKKLIGGIEAAGGTEMATGLAIALQEIQRPTLARSISRVILLTDGRTYGDDGRCVEIARRLQSRGIGITALGIGEEWNEDLLETIAARENSRTHYITAANEINQIFTDEVKRMHSIFAQGVELRIEGRPGTSLRSLDRVRPFISNLPAVEAKEQAWHAVLGDWPEHDIQAFMLEIVVPPLEVGEHPLMRISLNYNLPGMNLTGQREEQVLRVPVQPADEADTHIDAIVRRWLEKLVAYRLQASAWSAVEAGKLDEATRRLQMAGTRLFEAGEIELAHTVQEEATRLLRSGSASAEGRKRIKYGTRGLIDSGEE